jgi:ferredoxin
MGDKHRVRFEPVGIEIEVDEEQTVLRSAFEQGLMLMHGCKEGQCAACKSFVLDGEDIELDRYSTFALPDFEKDEGFTLLCRAHVYEDVTIELLNFDEDMIRSGLPIQQAVAEVVAITPVPTGYLAVGRLGTGQRATGSIAWLSADATTWRRIDDPALAGGLVAAVAVTPNGVLAVGSDLDEREAAVWTSVDGETWTKAPQEASRLHFGEKVRMTDLVATETGYVGVGNFVGVQYGTGTSWLSKDGLTWLAAPLQAALGQGEPEAVIAWRDRLISVGSRGAPDNYIPSVWISPNVP